MMPMRDPIAVYNASTNIEAHLICHALEQSGIIANVVEDNSAVGLWIGGAIPEIHKPQIWVERRDADAAREVIEQHEQQAAANQRKAIASAPILVECEECGKEAVFPPVQSGTLQECPHCRAYVDVGDPTSGEWDESLGGYRQEPGGA